MSQPASIVRFGALLEAELHQQGGDPVVRSFSQGDNIFVEGDPGDGMYVILDGKISISTKISRSENRSLIEMGAGDFFGEMAIIDRAPRSASATAVTDARLLYFSQDQAQSLMEQSPRLALSLLRAFSRRMREFNRHFAQEIVVAERLSLVGGFARSIVHDFKNQLGVILLASDLAASQQANLQMRQLARDRIHQQVERLTDMLNEVLSVSGGTSAHTPEPLNLSSYVAELETQTRDELLSRDVVLEVQTPPPDVVLLFSPKRINHVFFNLFNNAADFMPEGGRIMLRFHMGPKEVTVEVEDTGPGLKPEVADKLFTPFFTEGKASGTGLGLSICRNIVEDHGGRIRAIPQPGRGAVFSFTLPRAI